jgi:two-component system LytT family response regulator
MATCILIDDELQALKLLRVVIEQYCPSLNILGEAEDLPNGIKLIRKVKPDIVFLDIEMPGHSGLEIMDFFNEDEVNFNIIFTTAYSEYAIQAFRLSAIDYLLKPIQHSQLVEAVARYESRTINANVATFKNLEHNLRTGNDWRDKRIAIPSGQSIIFFKPEEIIMIKGEAAYSELYLQDGNKLLASRNLKHFEELLKAIPIFMRTHKSYIVNMNEVKQYVKSDGGYLQLSKNFEAGISGDKVDAMLSMLK